MEHVVDMAGPKIETIVVGPEFVGDGEGTNVSVIEFLGWAGGADMICPNEDHVANVQCWRV